MIKGTVSPNRDKEVVMDDCWAVTKEDELAFGCPNCLGGRTESVMADTPNFFGVRQCGDCGERFLVVSGHIEVGSRVRLTLLQPNREVLEGKVRPHPLDASAACGT